MARVCEMTGKRPFSGNNVSHSNVKTRARWLPNLKNKRFEVAELGQAISVKVCTRAIRTIDKKGGFVPALLDARLDGLSDRLIQVRRTIEKLRRA